MLTQDLLIDFSRYNHWANDRMIHWLRSKPAGILMTETSSSFPSIYATLLHIWGAEDIWLRRLKGASPTDFIANTFRGSKEDLFAGLLGNSQAFTDFLISAGPVFFEEKLAYQNTKGQAFHTPNPQVALHCLQHSTYHRGQIVTMGRSLGLTDPPQTDYIAYLRL
ncbi:MAG: DNA polymerase [Bacteroidetes bacterium]|nr:MAG: DNA polymerase [Bacteroidota bacterium]